MRETKSNIWKYRLEGSWIVIATNGTIKDNGVCDSTEDIVSFQVNLVHPDFFKELGKSVKKKGNVPICMEKYKIITFPVKKSRDGKPDMDLILANIPKLLKIVDEKEISEIYMTQLGCGEEGLDWETDIKPTIKKLLDDRFVVTIRKNSKRRKFRKSTSKIKKKRKV